ncbi:MAG: hypothetical protein QM817_13235 [Archangium sp.]
MFSALCGRFARNETAIEDLSSDAATHPTVSTLLLPTLVASSRASDWAMADNIATTLCESTHQPSWMASRLLAELRADSPDEARRREGEQQLAVLHDSTELPAIHRAEVAFNLAVVAQRRGDVAATRRYLRESIQFAPTDVAKRALHAL